MSIEPGRGEPLRLSGEFGPINVGFLANMTLIDCDADGLNDFVVYAMGYRGGLFLFKQLPGKGTPRFGEQTRIDGRYGLPKVVEESTFWWGEKGIGRCFNADLNSDGLPDLVSSVGGRMVLFPNIGGAGKPRFGSPESLKTSAGDNVSFVDLDGDGILDIVEAKAISKGSYWPPFDPAKLLPKPIGPVYPGRYPNGRWSGNVPTSRILFHRGLGGLRFADGVEIVESSLLEGSVGTLNLSVGDRDGDGGLDMVIADRVGNYIILSNTGDRGRVRWRRIGMHSLPHAGLRPVLGKLRPEAPRDDLFLLTESSFIYYLKSRDIAGEESYPSEKLVMLSNRNPVVSVGNFSVPTVADMDGDGDPDLVVGNEDGRLTCFAGNGRGERTRFGQPALLRANGETVDLAAGPSGSPQGPMEAAYGYSCPVAADWDLDGRADLIVSDLRGYYYFLRNEGVKESDGIPSFAAMRVLRMGGDTLRTVWRVRPVVYDVDSDGLPDLVTLDRWGHLNWFRRLDRGNVLDRGRNFIDDSGGPIKLDGEMIDGHVHSGRSKLTLCDWDSDGDQDLLYGTSRMVESYKVEKSGRGGFTHVDWMENVGGEGRWVFKKRGLLLNRGGIPIRLGWHTATPEAVDWNEDGRLDLLIGTENGRVYYFERDFIDGGCPGVTE